MEEEAEIRKFMLTRNEAKESHIIIPCQPVKLLSYVKKYEYLYFVKHIHLAVTKVLLLVGLWALVNNAGIAGVASPFEWLNKDDIDQVLKINLYGVILVAKAFLPLVRRTPGRIVNMASVMARFSVSPVPYTVAKFGVEGFSDALRYSMNRLKTYTRHVVRVFKRNLVTILSVVGYC